MYTYIYTYIHVCCSMACLSHVSCPASVFSHLPKSSRIGMCKYTLECVSTDATHWNV